MKRINLYLPDELVQRLNLQAGKEGANFSSLTRKILSDYLEQKVSVGMPALGVPPGEQLLDLSKSVTGRLDRIHDAQTDLKAMLDLILHYAKRSAERS